MKFLSEPALLIDKVLVIADLHIGLEHEIQESGITIPSQIEKIKERLDILIKKTKANHLVILGDVKHQVPDISWQEFKEIPEFFDHFKINISIVKGNHDGNLERLVKNRDIHESSGFKIKKYGFIHGHAWPDINLLDCEYLIMAHVHPAIEFYSAGFRAVEPCWLKSRINKASLKKKYKLNSDLKQGIIIPAFNHLIGGMAFNSRDFKPLGPLLKNNVLKWKDSEVYLLDGTFLGNLKNLKSNQ
jgi:putative SbcD/Mre11-related phosphoesterase